MLKKIVKNKKGVTLLELVVAVAIFSVTILTATQIFKMSIDGQRNAISAQNLQEGMRYALEVMGKEMRMAQKDDGDCATVDDTKIYQTGGSDTILYFKNYDDECVKYSLVGSRLEIDRNDTPGYYITPDEIQVTNLEFDVVDNVPSDQSRATIKMDVETIGKEIHKQTMKIQTTVSSRYYE